MFGYFAKKIFGTSNDRFIKSMYADVEAINDLEESIVTLSDAGLRAKTAEFKERLTKGETLGDLQNEAFAVVREAAKRTLGQRHYDVQLIGGMVLHKGMITEMKTGEGKTLVATLAAYLNALEGKGVHVVTVNDYLAKRDSEWMSVVYNFLGLSCDYIISGKTPDERKEAYQSDIIYATNNELGFDFLRDNMKFTKEDMVMRPFNFAIVDEVDSILIDEARTPLIISGPVDDRTDLYVKLDKYIPKLREEDFELDEKNRSVSFTEEGTNYLEEIFVKDGLLEKGSNLYDLENISLVHHANQALRAHKIFTRDKDYMVIDERVMIVDEFTGRMMDGRRYSEGLHQALEAKENVPIQRENQTLASITFQNFFRMYPKLSGMTGTAMTEASEFDDIYKLRVVEVPTHRPIARVDDDDLIYRTEEEKIDALIAMVKECQERKQPVLLGTVSIEKSEVISKALKKAKIKHNVLNARYHEQEAQIIANAGQPGAITVATNMAGRGTDIKLGGNPDMLIEEAKKTAKNEAELEKIAEKIRTQCKKDEEIVKEAGGLCVVGSERHESRRIDNQLRGRSGRQGDPGYSIFFLSAQDDLIRIFGADKKMDWIMGTMGEPGEPVSHPMLSKIMEKSQQKVEARNYEVRKNLLKFDDVMNDQRKAIFSQRVELMEAEDADAIMFEMAEDVIDDLIAAHVPPKSFPDQWETDELKQRLIQIFAIDFPVTDWAAEEGVADEEMRQRLHDGISALFKQKKDEYGEEVVRDLCKQLLLFTLDELWKDHLLSLDHLRQGINLRAYGQKDPLNEYKREAFALFGHLLEHLRETVITRFSHMRMQSENVDILKNKEPQQMTESHPSVTGEEGSKKPVRAVVKPEDRDPTNPDTWGKVSRNEECPCGSGKKYKQCHGKLA